MTRRNNTEERELLDPALSALLQEAFLDDPALAPAPGRTERIMRTVLAAEKRKPAAPFWASMIWGFGATAAAALLLALLLGLGGMWKSDNQVAVKHDPKNSAPQKQVAPTFKSPKIDEIANLAGVGKTPEQQTTTMQDPNLKMPERPHHDPTPSLAVAPKAPKLLKPTVPPAPSKDEVVVAAALYKAGTTAYHTGDYETAYQAFQDSYDTVPTPEAALSSGKALMDMARQELAADNTGDV